MEFEKVGLIGTGRLGEAVSRRLLQTGVELGVYNRTVEKAKLLQEMGAKLYRHLVELVEEREILITLLSDGPVSLELLLDPQLDWRGRWLIQMGTIAPHESRALAKGMKERGGRYLEAPVLGSAPQALAGELLVMVAGEWSDYDRLLPLLTRLGASHCHHVGATGQAAALKLALNQLIATLTAAFAASHSYLKREGVDVGLFMNLLRDSALYAPTFDKKLALMESRSYRPTNFSLRHMLKDVNLIRSELGETGPIGQLMGGVKEAIERAMERGFSLDDYSALYEGFVADRE